jgi:hypothetical protein
MVLGGFIRIFQQPKFSQIRKNRALYSPSEWNANLQTAFLTSFTLVG